MNRDVLRRLLINHGWAEPKYEVLTKENMKLTFTGMRIVFEEDAKKVSAYYRDVTYDPLSGKLHLHTKCSFKLA